MTPRIWEALLFGSIPIGLNEMTGIHQYLSPLQTVENGNDLTACVSRLSEISLKERDDIRQKSIDQISFMDARYFVDKIERFA